MRRSKTASRQSRCVSHRPEVVARTVAVTGAGGFIGAALCRCLVERGYRLRALYRRPPPRDSLPRDGVMPIQGDLSDRSSLARLLEGASHVVHCAGLVKAARPRRFGQVNVVGTRNLLEQVARVAPQARGILVSSLAARHPLLSPYAHSKAAAEWILRQEYPQLRWSVVRPPATYGPGDRELAKLWGSMRRGLLPVPGDGNQKVSLIHVADLVAAVACLLEVPAGSADPIELHDGTPGGYRWVDIARCGEAVFGRRVNIFRCPAGVLHSVAYANLGLARLLHYAPMLTPGKVRELLHPDWVCGNESMSICTAWYPRWSLKEGLQAL